MTNENISVQNDVETIEIATTDIDVKEEIVDTEVTTNVENEQKAQDDDYLLVVNDLKEYFPISKSLIKSNTVYLKAVDGVSLKLKAGHTIGIVGESGCGKTTLGRTILRLYEPTGGEVIFEGKHIEKLKGNALRKMRPNFQMIFQDPYSSLSPRMTVGEIVGEAVKVHHIVPKEQYKDYIVDIMTKCGLQPHYFDRYPHEFSGGQRQRICIAKALALKPKLVICDEPVSALDVSIQAQIINLFKDLQESDNLAYLFISHDLSVVEHISDEVGVMYLGNMVEYGSKRDLFDNPLHPYTKALFSAVPVPDPDSKINRIVLQGDIPSPANPPKGCKFHTRCSDCMSACKLFQPKFTDLGGGHYVACHKYDQKVLDEMPFYDELCKLEDARNAELDEMKAQKQQKKEDVANKIKDLLKIKK
ncbi:oligopeptide/dipeptide ABC transporter ATPase subunit [Firmicutes bacterium CAG:475]|jgi:oligopeptide/dipeptide ABC transporter, ATP-binding protein, C-terminal domain|nr:dipeptide ABC transporter ATP-binding protein [Clostridia bacterium]CDD69375.1 oligopeptide/dipeptide ABC transporter ATPase subunit [Firmicutes bacterium CAG:475]